MSEGHDWSQPPFVRKVYRWPFGKTFCSVFIIFIVVAVAVTAYFLSQNSVIWHALYWVFALVFTVVVSLLVTLLFYLFGRVELTPESICTMNDFSLRQTMHLDGIERVSRTWYGLGLFLLVKGKESSTQLWVPLFLQNMEGFIRSLAQAVPPDNPLRTYFDSRS